MLCCELSPGTLRHSLGFGKKLRRLNFNSMIEPGRFSTEVAKGATWSWLSWPAWGAITPSYQLPKCLNLQQPPVLPLYTLYFYLHNLSLGDQTKSLSALRLLFLHLHASTSIYLPTYYRTPAPLLLMPSPPTGNASSGNTSSQCVVRGSASLGMGH